MALVPANRRPVARNNRRRSSVVSSSSGSEADIGDAANDGYTRTYKSGSRSVCALLTWSHSNCRWLLCACVGGQSPALILMPLFLCRRGICHFAVSGVSVISPSRCRHLAMGACSRIRGLYYQGHQCALQPAFCPRCGFV